MSQNYDESFVESLRGDEESKSDLPEIFKQSSKQDEPSQIKIVVVGPPGTGKSSLIQSVVGKPFEDDIKSTNCYEIHCKKMSVQNREFDVRIWDCNAYHYQSYSGVKKAFYRNAIFALIVVGCNSTEYLIQQLADWIEESHNNDVYQTIIILSKADLIARDHAQDSARFLGSQQAQNIQLSQSQQNDTVTYNDFEAIKDEISKAFPNMKFYFGSAKENIKTALPYPELIKDLIKEIYLTTNNQSRFDSEKMQYSYFKTKQQQNKDDSNVEVKDLDDKTNDKKQCSIF